MDFLVAIRTEDRRFISIELFLLFNGFYNFMDFLVAVRNEDRQFISIELFLISNTGLHGRMINRFEKDNDFIVAIRQEDRRFIYETVLCCDKVVHFW